MSRRHHIVVSEDMNLVHVVLGWDAPLETYFAQVWRYTIYKDEDPDEIYGTLPQEHPVLSDFIEFLSEKLPELELQEAQIAVLADDKTREGYTRNRRNPALQKYLDDLYKHIKE